MVSTNEFIREYVKAMQDGSAAIFAGAGLSHVSGFVDWRGLLKTFASDINLDINKEHDLITITQYYCNARGGRGTVNQRILNSFMQGTDSNASIDELVQLPINIYWTTNYDRLLEEKIQSLGKTVDVKVHPESLAVAKEERDVTIYKMHGDYQEPSFCVLTKDDYESYNNKRQLFTTALQGDLVTKTFLFIGISFDDPNINYILGNIRVLLGENARPHYWLIEGVHQKENESLYDFKYRQVKQNLRIQDLLRYSIHAVEIDRYSDIPIILSDMRDRVNRNKVFISGSAHEYGSKWSINAIQFIRELTKQLLQHKYRVATGHGRGIGSYVISSAVEICMQNNRHISRFLDIFAFPYEDSNRNDYETLKHTYRQTIMDSVGVAIFIFGNKENNGKVICAQGVWNEYILAKKTGKIIIPIGSTGYQAKVILDDMLTSGQDISYLDGHIEVLQNSLDYLEIIQHIISILESINDMTD